MKKCTLLLVLLTLALLSATSAFAAEGEPSPVILMVSFGTSYNDTRAATIEAIEAKVAEAFPDYEVRRAFTSQIIIDKLKQRDGLDIDNVEQALAKLTEDGVKTLIVQPTHVMNGYEYDEMMAALSPFADKFDDLRVGDPLLTSVEDYFAVIDAVVAEIPGMADDTAYVFMGHGTHHFANSTYAALDYMFKAAGYPNVFIGTVEGYPELETVMKQVQAYGANKVVLRPLMIVAGDHAENDMAGDEEDSWKTAFKAEGYDVECQLVGLGEYAGVQQRFAEHVQAAIDGEIEE